MTDTKTPASAANLFRTGSLYFAAALVYLRYPIVKTQETDQGRHEFYFEDPNGELRTLESQFYNNTLQVDAAGYSDALRKAKDQMFGKRSY